MNTKLIIGLSALALSGTVNAGTYFEDFNDNPGYTSSDSAIGATGSAKTYFSFGEYVGATSNRDFPVSQADGVFHIVSGNRSNRNRGLAVFIDTSGWVADTYTVSFEVSNWSAGSGASPGTSGFKVWEGSGLNTGWIDVDLADNTASSSATPSRSSSSTASAFNDLGNTWGGAAAATGIMGNGTISFDVVLTEAGQAGDYMALGWVSQNYTTESPNYDFDDVRVTNVPEPATYALLGGLLALGHVMVRRRR